jgi:hypothetical protein
LSTRKPVLLSLPSYLSNEIVKPWGICYWPVIKDIHASGEEVCAVTNQKQLSPAASKPKLAATV